MNAKGITVIPSPYSVKETIDSLETFLKQHGATIYARINQQSEVQNTGQNLLPLEFLMFGNPKAGGSIMALNPLTALDLPLKIIAWQDGDGKVWLAYNDAAYIEDRYFLQHAENSPLNLDKMIGLALVA